MDVTVNIPDADVAFLDAYAAEKGYASRADALRRAIGLLRSTGLAGAYRDAWDEWIEGSDGEAWAVTTGDDIS